LIKNNTKIKQNTVIFILKLLVKVGLQTA